MGIKSDDQKDGHAIMNTSVLGYGLISTIVIRSIVSTLKIHEVYKNYKNCGF